jgi:hypothetical protein
LDEEQNRGVDDDTDVVQQAENVLIMATTLHDSSWQSPHGRR